MFFLLYENCWLVVFAAGADLKMICTVFRLRLRRLMLDLFQSSVLFQKSREGSSDDSHPKHRVSRGNWTAFFSSLHISLVISLHVFGDYQTGACVLWSGKLREKLQENYRNIHFTFTFRLLNHECRVKTSVLQYRFILIVSWLTGILLSSPWS